VKEKTIIPFYCYLICDIDNDKIKEYARGAGLTLTPDGLGYFGYNTNYNCYIEVISFNKLLTDAIKRNRILFDKLNMSK
jgi:hypothetical protein